jgi:hypothetical protein
MNEDTIAILQNLDLLQLDRLRDRYESRHDSASAANVREAIARKGATQTEELYNSGHLFARKAAPDDTGRRVTTWTGDPFAWMKHFMGTAAIGRFNGELCKGENSQQARDSRTGGSVVVSGAQSSP